MEFNKERPETKRADVRLIDASGMEKEQLFSVYGLNENGLDEEEVLLRREKFGSNEIARKKKDSLPKRLLLSFVNPFTVVLFVLTGISLFTDIILPPPGQKNYMTVIMVVTMVVISGLMTFIQESRSEKSAEKLSQMVRNTASVLRGGKRMEIPMNELVTGDHVFLASGDMLPADLRLTAVKDLFINQSALTGESEPVEKFASPGAASVSAPMERRNLAFMGSNVISGSAEGIVIVTGKETSFGRIAEKLTGKKEATSFDEGISRVSWMLIRFILVMAPTVFLVNGLFKTGNDRWLNALLFALSVAVGLTPEMLPMIVSANLAKGAVIMSRKKVIIKNLGAIQNLGAMDVLCTDKTGTLTEDRIALEYHCNIRGEEDPRVLRHAFLNSYFQTGLKNLMDEAIIRHADEEEMKPLREEYRKVDEIPFDFNRRRMSVVVEDKRGKQQMITKGAIEEMLGACSFAEFEGKVEPVTEQLKGIILQKANEFNTRGFRVLGIAHKNHPSKGAAFSVEDEKDMVLIGYLAFLDPPKESAAEAIANLVGNGVHVKILTGDNDAVTRHICRKVGMEGSVILLGSELAKMTDEELAEASESVHVFAKLSPDQKTRVVSVLRRKNTVGFMGDGINDAAAMKAADVGISVDTAVDIAKESADIILTEKDLNVLERGIIEGRRTYANTMKYIKMTASSNFGNMFSILAASIFLPFLPMLPVQILILNLIYDISCLALPFDNVDADYLKIPRKWDAGSISRFMLWFGPVSSVFDILTYLVMFFVICPQMTGAGYRMLGNEGQLAFAALFQAGWFVESQWTQTFVVHSLRTRKIPFIQSRASVPVFLLSGAGILVSTCLAVFLGFGTGPQHLPLTYFLYLLSAVAAYSLLVAAVKKIYIAKYGELI
ncbi:MAG TPA: magnesium-translocating P-type ATPase [Lachnospiraceae bacterium]|nr:magnesium-translocating P-type ATPase [Lachnospiraceae bacterium]